MERTINARPSCPASQHEFEEAGRGVLFMNAYSEIKQITRQKKTLFGISLASSNEVSCTTKHEYVEIRGSITKCKKCGQVSGMVLMTAEELKSVISKYPVLEPIKKRIKM